MPGYSAGVGWVWKLDSVTTVNVGYFPQSNSDRLLRVHLCMDLHSLGSWNSIMNIIVSLVKVTFSKEI